MKQNNNHGKEMQEGVVYSIPIKVSKTKKKCSSTVIRCWVIDFLKDLGYIATIMAVVLGIVAIAIALNTGKAHASNLPDSHNGTVLEDSVTSAITDKPILNTSLQKDIKKTVAMAKKEELTSKAVFVPIPTPSIVPIEKEISSDIERDTYALQYWENHDSGRSQEFNNGLGEFKLTFYCACKKCCGKTPDNPAYGITASGAYVAEGTTIAVDPKQIELGSEVYIEGLGTFIAQDTGGAIGQNRIDVYLDSHQEALNCGVEYANVYIKG